VLWLKRLPIHCPGEESVLVQGFFTRQTSLIGLLESSFNALIEASEKDLHRGLTKSGLF
jgi:hypothetical protein